MSKLHSFIRLLGLIALAAIAALTSAQSYPNKPIRLVTSEPGSNANFTARMIAQGISASLGQSVIVESRGGGVIPADTVARAAPDGYTLLVHGGAFYFAPLLGPAPYDPIRDFSPVILAASSPNVLVIHPSLPVKSVTELIALARLKPGEIDYASANAGASSHLAAELFKSMAKVEMMRIPYKGAGPAMTGLIGGQVQLMFAPASAAAPPMKSGRLNGLAVTSPKPSELVPGLPTIATVLPGYESASNNCLFAPAKTPEAIIFRLNQDTSRYLSTAEAKERFLAAGVEPMGGSSEQLATLVKMEILRIGKVIKEAGIRVE